MHQCGARLERSVLVHTTIATQKMKSPPKLFHTRPEDVLSSLSTKGYLVHCTCTSPIVQETTWSSLVDGDEVKQLGQYKTGKKRNV